MFRLTEFKPKFSSCTLCAVCIAIAFFITGIKPLHAQDSILPPKVGLALSGGAAHGIAHLGVLKVMEEAGLRPDYITGVSMGSIIGGMYAVGYSSDSLLQILRNTDWKLALSNNIPGNKIIFSEKKHSNNSLLTIPLYKRRMIIPSGLIKGQQIESLLSFYTWPAADINDFSKLPIPFLCLGTDIINYRPVQLKTGYLADALRASSAIPTIFSPIRIDSILLVDGGLTCNLAVTPLKEMGADFIIGSYVGFDRVKESDMQAASGIMKQIGISKSLETYENDKRLVDLLIFPQTDGISKADFEDVDSLFQRGYRAALPHHEYFKKLAEQKRDQINRVEKSEILTKQHYSFNRIEIAGNEYFSDKQILGILNINPEEIVDKHLLTERIELLYGRAWFDKIKYRIVPRNDSLILIIECTEKYPSILYASVHYDNSLRSGLVLGLSLKDFLTRKSLINFDSYIAQYYRLNLNYIQFIDRSQKLGVSANFYADNTMLPMWDSNGSMSQSLSRNYIHGISLFRAFGLNHMTGLSISNETQNNLFDHKSGAWQRTLIHNFITGSFYYQVNTLNSKHFPDRGLLLNLSAGHSLLMSYFEKTDSTKIVYSDSSPGVMPFEAFSTFSGHLVHYFTRVKNLTFSIGGDILLITDSDSTTTKNNFRFLGGIESVNHRSIAMVGFHSFEIPVTSFAGIRSEFDIEFLPNLHLNFLVNFFAAQLPGRGSEYSLLAGYGAGVGYMSIIGPIKVGVMYGAGVQEPYFRKAKAFITMGYSF